MSFVGKIWRPDRVAKTAAEPCACNVKLPPMPAETRQFHAYYSDTVGDWLKSFDTAEERTLWMGQFVEKHLANLDGDILLLFNGDLVVRSGKIPVNNVPVGGGE